MAKEIELRSSGSGSAGASVDDDRLSDEPAALSSLVVPSTRMRGGQLALSLGFLAFGFMLGHQTGFSMSSGISQVLLTSLFTFVGGVLLSYAGLRKHGSGLPDPFRVGTTLGSLALGLMIGTPAGVYMRCNKAANAWFLGEQVEHSQCRSGVGAPAAPFATTSATEPRPGVGAMAADRPKCIAAQKTLSKGVSKGSDENELHRLIHGLIEACELPQP